MLAFHGRDVRDVGDPLYAWQERGRKRLQVEDFLSMQES